MQCWPDLCTILIRHTSTCNTASQWNQNQPPSHLEKRAGKSSLFFIWFLCFLCFFILITFFSIVLLNFFILLYQGSFLAIFFILSILFILPLGPFLFILIDLLLILFLTSFLSCGLLLFLTS